LFPSEETQHYSCFLLEAHLREKKLSLPHLPTQGSSKAADASIFHLPDLPERGGHFAVITLF